MRWMRCLKRGDDSAARQRAAAQLTMKRLGLGDDPPSIRAARSVLAALEKRLLRSAP